MQQWIIIASADQNWGIGYENHLLARVPEDMKQVSAKTKGKVIVMGRKTLESFPGGKPLADRTNIVLTENRSFTAENALVAHGISDLMNKLKNYEGEVYVFGGESIYRQLLPYCSKAYITRFHTAFQADAFLPCFDMLEGWDLVEEGPVQISRTGLKFQFLEYRIIQKG
jgi:dihydrofolate reductase